MPCSAGRGGARYYLVHRYWNPISISKQLWLGLWIFLLWIVSQARYRLFTSCFQVSLGWHFQRYLWSICSAPRQKRDCVDNFPAHLPVAHSQNNLPMLLVEASRTPSCVSNAADLPRWSEWSGNNVRGPRCCFRWSVVAGNHARGRRYCFAAAARP